MDKLTRWNGLHSINPDLGNNDQGVGQIFLAIFTSEEFSSLSSASGNLAACLRLAAREVELSAVQS